MSVSVSIIVPVYNVEKYLPQCLESALSQSLRSIEIICVDDGSTDRSLAILNAYSENYSTIRIIRHEKNQGLAFSRNSGLDKALGDFIFFLDSDDLLYSKDSIQQLYAIAVTNDSDEVIGGMLTMDESTNETDLGYHQYYLKAELRSVRHSEYPYLFQNVVSCNKLIKRKFLLKQSIRFDSELKKYEDNPFSCMVHVLADSISLTTKSTYVHRIRQDTQNRSITQEFANDHIWHIKAGKAILDFLVSQEVSNEVLFLHQYRMFVWLGMDTRQAHVSRYSISKEEIFRSYYPILASIPKESVTSMKGDMTALMEALRTEDYDAANTIIINEMLI